MNDYFLALGGGDEIGASCYLFSIGSTRILIDAGMRFRTERTFPDFAALIGRIGSISEIDAFLLTHAHLDHCGALTRLQYEAPNIPKYATKPTIDIASVMLADALQVANKRNPEDWSIAEHSRGLLQATLDGFTPVYFNQPTKMGTRSGTVIPIRAGHILGATSYFLEIEGRRILHSGDVSLHGQRLIAGMDLEGIPEGIDVLIIESTYAYQPEHIDETVEEQYFALANQVSRIVENGGRVLIPAFALGRAQEIAALFRELIDQGLVPEFPIILDGMVKAVCEIYDRHRPYLQGRSTARMGHAIYGDSVRPTPDRFYPSQKNTDALAPACVIASSGMLLDSTRSSIYAQHFLPNERDAILFSGYLDDESPGARLSRLSQGNKSALINGSRVAVKAEVAKYHLSAHAPSRDLRALIRWVKPKTLILVHGEYRYDGEASFIEFLMHLRSTGMEVHHAANGIPIFL
jgi:Cft2 family RNA processing exonuclease